MNSLLDVIIVVSALLASVVYAALALGPRSWRRTLRARLGFKDARVPANSAPGACGGCDGCGSAPAAPAADEIKVPVADIRRR